MLEHKWPRLLPMALGAALGFARHGQAARGFKNISAMRVVALNAIHPALKNGMVLGQMEFRFGLEVAPETGRGLLGRVHDKFAPSAAGLDVLTARAMTRFASGLANQFRVGKMDAGMRAGGEHARDIGMTFVAGLVARIGGAGNLGRRHDCPLKA
jgi:hypothetical protein